MTILRIGCIGDVHGASGSLARVIEYLRAAEVDGVLFTGDFARGPLNADPALGNTATPEQILDLAASSFSSLLLVPGNHDDPRLGGDLSVDQRQISWLGLRVAGVGGSPYTGRRFPYEWSDNEADFSDWPAPEILLAHSPPADTGLDRITSGRAVGSKAIREIAERMNGLLVCGHIHEAVGTFQLANCLCYNAGSLGEPFGAVQCGIATLDDKDATWRVDHVVLT